MRLGPLITCCGGLALLLPAAPASAQTPLPYNAGDAAREANEARRPPLPRPAATPVLPQLTEPAFTMADRSTLFVRSFVVEGSTLGSEAEVRAILSPYEKRSLTLAQIYAAADKVTALYRSQGYMVAKAYVPAQDARGGVLRIKVVPGRFGAVTVKNESLVRDSFIQGVVNGSVGAGQLIHRDALERAMLLISDLPGAMMPRGAIGPGRQPETSDFVFNVPAARRIDGYVTGDNYGSPFTGRNRLSGGVNLNSPLGIGDRLSLFGMASQEGDLVNGRVAYSLPLSTDGLRAEIAAYRTTYALGGVYSGLDATGVADGLSASLSYALRRRRDDSIFLAATYTHKALTDEILNTTVSDHSMDTGTASISRETVGAIGNLPLVTSTLLSFTGGELRFADAAQEAANRAGPNTVGWFSKVNFAFNATVAFNALVSLSTTFRAQKSLTGNLDSSEQMGLTGYWGVKTFDEGLAGDTGYLFTPELKVALPDMERYRHAVGVFTDIGAVWIEDPSYTVTQKSRTQLNDVGVGYYATYEYLPGRNLLLKAQVAKTYGSNEGAVSYDQRTRALMQVGFTF